jgi:hypothetical protein
MLREVEEGGGCLSCLIKWAFVPNGIAMNAANLRYSSLLDLSSLHSDISIISPVRKEASSSHYVKGVQHLNLDFFLRNSRRKCYRHRAGC